MHPRRLAKGVVVLALAGAFGGLLSQGAAAATQARNAMLEARAVVADAALDAVQTARAASDAAEAVTLDHAAVDELAEASAELEELLDEAGALEQSGVLSARTTATTSRSGERGAAGEDAAADEDATSAPVDPSATAPAESAPAGSAPAEPAPAEAATTDPAPAAPAPTAADESTRPVVVPPVAGPEDTTTRKLREAVERVVELSEEVAETTQEERERIAAAEKAAAEKAAAEKAAAEAKAKAEAEAKAKAEAEAKAKAEAEAKAKAAQRAAWKSSVNGYANGRIPASVLCAPSFDSSALLRCDAAEDLSALDAAYYEAFGTHLSITSSYRSYSAQVSCRRTKGWLCAAPGTSNHGTGIAVDLGGGIQTFGTKQHKWMQANAAAYGWVHPSWARAGGSKPEAWHWEYTR